MADQMDHLDRYERADVRAGSVMNLIIGIWLILSPFILGFSSISSAVENNIIVGALVAIFAISGLVGTRIAWSRIINVVFGIWLFFSPFALGFDTSARAMWNNVILGIIVIVLASWSASLASSYHRPQIR
ncbi:MAG: SPW repeat protein [Patescibacteria group bacterium]|nr:SPW repeat protein [Patescibacteria group bacterium]